jgi:uncharacterized protein (TIGR02453 family)
MSSHIIQAHTFDFLRDLSENNHREWFQAHKPRYEKAHANMIAFAEALMDRLLESDQLVPMSGKKILFRIYRDVRFSKNKAPYKNHFSGRFKRDTPWLRGGYYFHLMPGGSFLAGGFWGPDKEDMKRIRDEFVMDAQPMREIMADPDFVKHFGTIRGKALKTAPKGFDREHPDIDLIRMKQWIVSEEFSDEEVMGEDLVEKMAQGYEAMRPFFDYMSEVLTTDAHGVRHPLAE